MTRLHAGCWACSWAEQPGGNAVQVGGNLPASQDVRNIIKLVALDNRARQAWWGNVLPAQVGGQGAPLSVRVAQPAQPVAFLV